MFLQILIGILSGLIVGIISGLIPGVHINLIFAILAGLSFTNSPLILFSFVISSSISYLFSDPIPAVLLGAPNEESALTALPGHKLLLQGNGQEAILLSLHGSILALIITLLISPFFLFVIPNLLTFITSIIPYLLLGFILYSWFREKDIIKSGIVIILAGILGLITFFIPIRESLTPLLTGLFGLSSILTSSSTKINKQKTVSWKNSIPNKVTIKDSIIGFFSVIPFAGTLPGIGTGQIATLASEIKTQSSKSFIILNGMLNTCIMLVSFLLIINTNRTRSASAVLLKSLLSNIPHPLLTILILSLISGIIAYLISINLAKYSTYLFSKINYNKLKIFSITTIAIITFFVSGFIGLLVLATSTSLGIYTIKSEVKRIHLTSSLIVPTIISYLFL